jgi:phenylacetic acid degradation protein
VTFYEIDGVVPAADPSAYVHPLASVIGDVIIGPGCYVGPGASLRGDFGRIIIGAGSNVQDCCVLHGAILHGCQVGRHVLGGMNAVIMDGAVIGEDSLVGACSFVRAGTTVAPRSLVVGNPAKILRELDPETVQWKRNGVHVYQELARRSRSGLRAVEPLPAPEPDRPRVSTDSSVSRPLHEMRAEWGPGTPPSTGERMSDAVN